MQFQFLRKNLGVFLTLIIVGFMMNISNASAASFVAKNNQVISYTDVGQGEPIVLIHAFPTDQQLWLPQLNGLKQHFRVITLDLWGFGHSGSTDGRAIAMTDYAGEVKELLNHLHVDKAIIGGESMGGYIALAYLQQYPNNVNGLILSDTQSVADSAEAKVAREAAAVDILEHGTGRFINGFLTKIFSPMASAEKINFLKTILEAQTKTAMASALRGMSLREDTSSVLANTQVPILIITGDQDGVILPQQSQNMHGLAKNSKLVVVSKAGHLPSLEQPEEWNQAVIEMFYQLK